jgi:hypothetical protein
MSDLNPGRWIVTEGAITIDYALGVLEQIRALAEDGFQRLSRGGVEIGGILFGRHEGQNVRILVMRPVECAYARGPVYLLSESDRIQFLRTLDSFRTEPALQGMTPVGWFVSHTRGELELTDSDREIFANYFPKHWQVTLVIRPTRMGAARAAFFVRNPNGGIHSATSQGEFTLEPLRQAEMADALAGSVPMRRPMADPVVVQRESPRLPVRMDPELPRFLLAPPPVASGRWKWVVVACLAVLCCVLGARVYLISRATEPLALKATDQDGEMRIEWSRQTAAVKDAKRGVLEITDDRKTRMVPLSAEELSRGVFSFVRKGADVDVRLVVYDPSGAKAEEVTRYLGQPIPDPVPSEIGAAHAERDQLREQNAKLQKELRAETARTQQLERRTRELENLLRIERMRAELMRPH